MNVPNMAALPAVAENLHGSHVAEFRGPTHHNRIPRNSSSSGTSKPDRRSHQSEGGDVVRKGVAGRAQDGKRRHVGAEERGQEDVGSYRSAREESCSAGSCVPRRRNAKMPMYNTTER